MKFINMIAIALLTMVSMASCEKSSASLIPSNLVINTNVSTDGTGNVTFTATANNATNFAFEFGDGISQAAPSGVVTHQYTAPGSNTYTVKVTAVSASADTVSGTVDVTINVVGGTPGLVWAEEFNVAGAPNASNWGYDVGAGGWGNQELQYYTNRSENVVVSNGTLKITARRESFSGSDFTSARILTRGKFDFKYGRVEARAKLPAGAGVWPAIWSLGANFQTAGWPDCGEMDIMEQKGSDPNRIYGTLHYPGRSGGTADGSSRVISNATTEFHLYQLEWSPTLIRVLVDGQLIHTVANSPAIPFNQNFFLIMNVAMGGTFGGPVAPAVNGGTMEVDYIRVYNN